MIKAMKKVLACSLAAAVAFSGASVASAATKSPSTSVKPISKDNVSTSAGKVDTNKNGTAAITTVKKTNSKKVTVASTVTVNGVKYKVTKIDANAFKNCKKVTKVTLPKTVTVIAKNAFAGAKKLNTISLNVKKSITVKKGAFKGLNTKKMTIKVSKKMSAKELKKFKKALKAAGFTGKVVKAL